MAVKTKKRLIRKYITVKHVEGLLQIKVIYVHRFHRKRVLFVNFAEQLKLTPDTYVPLRSSSLNTFVDHAVGLQLLRVMYVYQEQYHSERQKLPVKKRQVRKKRNSNIQIESEFHNYISLYLLSILLITCFQSILALKTSNKHE